MPRAFTPKVVTANALLEGDVRRRRRRQVIDQLAAALLLQSFLDHPARTVAPA